MSATASEHGSSSAAQLSRAAQQAASEAAASLHQAASGAATSLHTAATDAAASLHTAATDAAASLHSAATDAAASLAATVAEIKPRLRGWLHAYAALVSLITGTALISVSAALRGDAAGTSTAIYASTVTLLFGTSALYHRLPWSDRGRAIMRNLDHSMIFVFIAGTYTPIAALTLPESKAIAVLAVVWTGAFFGVIMQTTWKNPPRWLSAPVYLALGWVAVFVARDLVVHAGIAAATLIAVGGVVYSIGAVVYATKKPDPWPGTFGFHEVFHLCTLVAAVCHYIAIWFAVFS